MPILYPEKTLQPCTVSCRVVQKDGYTPASFASVTVFKVFRFLWWDILWYVTGGTADFYGKIAFSLERNTRYKFRVGWTGTDGKRRGWEEPLITQICPWTMTLKAPW
jgi:hypothetical protein